MSETTPETPETTPQDKGIRPLGEGETSGFAAFNKTLGVYVGGVHRGDKARTEAGRSRQAKAAKDQGHDVEVRAV